MDKRIDFLYLNEPEMIEAGVTDIARCIDVMEEALVLLADGDYMMAGDRGDSHGAMISFPKEPKHEGMPKDDIDRRFMAMPAYLGGRFRATGVKWYGSNIENRKFDMPRSIHLFVLNDTDTGAPKAVMSANLLSAYRTASVPNVGTKHLAVDNVETVGIIGPGVMSQKTLKGVLTQREGVKHVKIKGRSKDSTERSAQQIREQHPELESVTIVESEKEAVENVEILITGANASPNGSQDFPQVKGEWLSPGTLVIAPGATHFDDDFLINTRKVVDYMGLYDEWHHEYTTQVAYDQIGIIGSRMLKLQHDGHFPREDLQQMGDIAAGRIEGRTSDDEIIIYSVGGMPVEDVAWAHDIYNYAVEHNIGTSLNLWEEPSAY